MQGRLAAMIALAAGCSFDGPGLGTDAGTSTIDAPAAGCGTAYDFDHGGHKYRLVSSEVSWTAARSNCEADGGYLLKIDSADEDQEVEDAYIWGRERSGSASATPARRATTSGPTARRRRSRTGAARRARAATTAS
jgi:hypothetical protein